MSKIKITADNVLEIIQGVFNDEDVNGIITDPSAPTEWINKSVQDVLNVGYYTFKHRPLSTQEVIAELMQNKSADINYLMAVNRSICLLSLNGVERLFSKDADMITVAAAMEYWIQSDKIKILEDLIEDCNIATSGLRVTVAFGTETRKAVIIFDNLMVTEIQPETEFGEMALCSVDVSMILYPDVVSYSDYKVEFSFEDEKGESVTSDVPLSSFSFVDAMTQKAVPYVGNTAKVGSINLSCANSFVLVFDGYNNSFINYITNKALKGQSPDNNQSFLMTVTRCNIPYVHDVVIKDHQIIVNADTGNETHTLSLVTRGMSYGIK